MSQSNLVYRSNVWPVGHKDVLKDTAFLRVLVDAKAIKHLRKKCESNGGNPRIIFSELQLKIADEGVLCSYAQGDPCWGLVIRDGVHTWECRCIRDECERFSACRPDCSPAILAEEKCHLALDAESLAAYDISKKIDFKSVVSQNEKPDPRTYDSERGKYFPVVARAPMHLPCDELDRPLLRTPYMKQQAQGTHIPTPHVPATAINLAPPQLPTEHAVNVAESVTRNRNALTSPAVTPSQDVESVVPLVVSSDKHSGNDPACVLDVREISADDLQRIIIEASVAKPVFVEAEPGTGKTHVLIERVNHMVTHGGVPPEQVIVLSFTNAAVNEVRHRLRAHVDAGTGSRGLRNVDVRTFHSLAWFLLCDASQDERLGGWQQTPLKMEALDYDASIRRAGELLFKFPRLVEGWHVIVDEVQDMTNERAFFVQALMKSCLAYGGSVTAFGDFCQSIYDYSVRADPAHISSECFRSYLLEHLNAPWLQCRLSHNHRQAQELAVLLQPYREALRSNSLSEIQRELAVLREAVPRSEKLLKDSSVLVGLSRAGRVCLLCRKNADVIQLSTLLHTRGIPHIANTHADNEALAAWIAEIFTPEMPERLCLEEFVIRASGSSLGSERAEQAWETIKLMLGEKGHRIAVHDILAALQKCRRDDPLFRPSLEHAITVSTVHKAKGREYDSVVVDATLFDPKENEQDLEEFKVLYVALTRPRQELFQAELTMRDRLRVKAVRPSGRKRILGFNKNKKLTYIEIHNEFDIDKGNFFFTDRSNSACVKVGDIIKLEKKKIDGEARYLIMHESDNGWQSVARMQHAFLEDLKSLVKPESYVDWPDSIEDLHVNAVFSHICEPAWAERGTLEAKLWIDFQGIGRLTYGTY